MKFWQFAAMCNSVVRKKEVIEEPRAWVEEETNFSKLILDCLDLSADLELTKIDEPRSSSVFHKNISFKNCGGWARKPPQNAPSFQQVLTSKH